MKIAIGNKNCIETTWQTNKMEAQLFQQWHFNSKLSNNIEGVGGYTSGIVRAWEVLKTFYEIYTHYIKRNIYDFLCFFFPKTNSFSVFKPWSGVQKC